MCYERVRCAIVNLVSHLPAVTNFYSDLQEQYKTCKDKLEANELDYNSSVNVLLQDIASKRDKPFDILEKSYFIDNQQELENSLEELKALITQNDERTASFENEKSLAIETVKKAYAADFEEQMQY